MINTYPEQWMAYDLVRQLPDGRMAAIYRQTFGMARLVVGHPEDRLSIEDSW